MTVTDHPLLGDRYLVTIFDGSTVVYSVYAALATDHITVTEF